jgi:DNA invertase Pin-like site-specific DNA recombinase
MATKYVAYYRVSTDKQGQSGLGLAAQEAAVINYLKGHKPIAEFTEVESGKKNDRPRLAEAIALCKRRKAILVIAKLDRLARNVHFISGLMETGINFVACDSPNDDRFILHVKAAVAEDEAKKISDRTKVALAAKRAQGKKLGGWRPMRKDGSARTMPTFSQEAHQRATEAIMEAADVRAEDYMDIIRGIQANGVTSATAIAGELNAQGVVTARGREWRAQTVLNVLRRGCENITPSKRVAA